MAHTQGYPKWFHENIDIGNCSYLNLRASSRGIPASCSHDLTAISGSDTKENEGTLCTHRYKQKLNSSNNVGASSTT